MEKVYVKSSKAVAELTGQRTLSLKQRQILIMIDGHRPQAYITKLFSHLDVERELANLEKLGFIIEKNDFPQVSQLSLSKHDVLDDLSYEQLANIKNFLISSLNQQVGHEGIHLAKQISNCKTNTALKPLIAQWRLTLRNNHQYKMQAEDYIGEFNHLLANPEEARFIGITILDPNKSSAEPVHFT